MTQIIAAIILAAGAFYGVYRGAAYAVDRLVAQLTQERVLSEERLDAEEKRLQMQLDAEAKRLDRQLAHDRWMREVEELRRLIDEAAAAGLAAGNAAHSLREPLRLELQSGEESPDFEPRHREAIAAAQGMQGFVERLELRLGHDHELPSAFSRWQHTIEEALESLEAEPPTKALLLEGGRRLTASSERYLEFMDASRLYVRLDPPAS